MLFQKNTMQYYRNTLYFFFFRKAEANISLLLACVYKLVRYNTLFNSTSMVKKVL